MLEINVSPETEQQLRDLAQQNNQSVADYAGEIIEKQLSNGNYAKDNHENGGINQVTETAAAEQVDAEDYVNPLIPFIGLFSSGKTDTSQRAREILRAELGERHRVRGDD